MENLPCEFTVLVVGYFILFVPCCNIDFDMWLRDITWEDSSAFLLFPSGQAEEMLMYFETFAN